MAQKIVLIRIIVISLFIFSFNATFSQDLIVTNEGDSLNCKITSVSKDAVHFIFKHRDEIRSTFLMRNNVKAGEFNYFEIPEIDASEVPNRQKNHAFRASLNVGWGYRLVALSDNIPSDFHRYYNSLKSGLHYGLNLSYFFSEHIGFGIKYSILKSGNQRNDIYIRFYDGTNRNVEMKEIIKIGYFGPYISTRLMDMKKENSLLLDFGVGRLTYTNDFSLFDEYHISGNSTGVYWGIGYDIGYSENLALGFALSYIAGNLSSYELKKNNRTETIKLKGEYEGLTRIGLSVGLRLILNN